MLYTYSYFHLKLIGRYTISTETHVLHVSLMSTQVPILLCEYQILNKYLLIVPALLQIKVPQDNFKNKKPSS